MGAMRSSGDARGAHAPLAALLLCALTAAEAAIIVPADLSVMMQLKERFSSKLTLPSWQATADCNAWERVACDGRGRVSGLYFMRDQLGGPFPSIITQLAALSHIYMDSNNFTGSIPSGLGQLQRLQIVRLNSNSLSGGLPASLGNLTQLVKFYVRKNGGLNGTIPSDWARLPMQEAFFDQNQFSGPLPECICNWTDLVQLRLSKNPWTGDIPKCLSRLTNLQSLYLDYAGPQFGGRFPKWIGNLAKLSQLVVNNNGITGRIPKSVGKLTSLRTFFASSNKLEGPLPSTMSKMVNLTTLNIEFNRVTGSIPPQMGTMTNLERILLDNNLMTGTIPATLGNLSKLTILLLQGNFFHGSVPAAIPLGCTSLVQFNLERNWLSGQPPTNFSSTGLRQINIRSNYFVGRMDYRTTSGERICPAREIPDPNSQIISSTKYNCLAGNSSCGSSYDEQQRPDSACTTFCRANEPSGPCDGNGFCRFRGKAMRATCTCFPGFRRTSDRLGCR